ncbi:MAG: 3-methyladenine DNA glycosylase AlkC [Colwellia sp.]
MSTVLSKEVINCQNTHDLGERVLRSWRNFDLKSFDKEIADNLPLQGLGDRIQQVRKSLYNHLPTNYEKSLDVLMRSLPEILPDDAFDTKLDLASQNGFIMISLTAFVARYGIDHYELSMNALKEMTKRFSAEGSIRYFIIKYPEKVLDTFADWVKDESAHVRRLVSESTRPRLPMMMALPAFKFDPSPIIPFLEILKNDNELFVRRSVANNLNDIAKDNPDVVTTLLNKWNNNKSINMVWLIKHSLRTLEKQGNIAALNILGFDENLQVNVDKFELKRSQINLGESLELSLILSTNTKEENLLIDYVIYHMKANGKLMPKVFKWSKKRIFESSTLNLTKMHPIKPISSRKYYAGRHEIHLQINGNHMAKIEFELKL